MEEVTRREGRTVCFVSHNLAAVHRLCDRSLLLREGRLVASGTPEAVADEYRTGDHRGARPRSWIPLRNVVRRGSGRCEVREIWYSGTHEETAFLPFTDGGLEVRLSIAAERAMATRSVAVAIYDSYGTKLVNADTVRLGAARTLEAGTNVLRFTLDSLHLNPGRYILGVRVTDEAGKEVDFIESALPIEVADPPGPVRPRPDWDGSVSCDFDVAWGREPDRR
jgi:lipopolysaccharide transport system ATP-binding protein